MQNFQSAETPIIEFVWGDEYLCYALSGVILEVVVDGISIFVSTHTWRSGTLSQNEIAQTIEQGDDSNCKVPGVFFYAQGMPVVVNKNIYTGLKIVNGAEFTAADVIPDPKSPGYHLADDITIHFGPPLGILLQSRETKDLAVPALPTGTVLIRPLSHTLDPASSHFRFLSGKCTRRGLPVVPAFVLTDYKAQSKTFVEVLLELRGNRMTNGQPSKCDFTSLYVQLSRYRPTARHNVSVIQDTRLGRITTPTSHKVTSPPANHPDPSRLPSPAGTPSVPHNNLPTTLRRPVCCTDFSARLLLLRRGPECGHSTSTRPQDGAAATASCPCARLRRCRHRTATPGRKPGLGVDIEIRGDLVVEVGTVCGLSAYALEDQRNLDEPWDGRHGLREDGMIYLDRRGGPRHEFKSLNVAPDDDGLDGP
ncbi:hypothetical protein MRS44_013837 [Fusarium solani]|uniref:uncharacterized protein n=1 Tax=Fusarium solani TaxID=169388 RepID=UPI0032C3F350|nr:hypothetical protein MRS44_013837 [Fusarium solani]